METATQTPQIDVSEASLQRLQASLQTLMQQRQELDRTIERQIGGIQVMQMLLAAEQEKATGSP